MMPDRARHGWVLTIGNTELFGGRLNNLGERRIVGVAHEGAEMMDDVMVEAASEPTYERVTRRIIGRCREDVIHAVIKLAAARGKVCAVDSVRRLEYQRYAQPHDQMDQHERCSDQPRRLPEHHYRQNEHVRNVESLPCKEDGVFPLRMPRTLQIVVGWEEKALKVPYEHIVEREHRVEEQRIDVLEPLQGLARFVWGKPKDAASRKSVVFAVDIDAGVVAPMVEDTPHVGVD